MLHLLKDYAERHGIVAEPGFTRMDIKWAIICDDSGQFEEIIELGNPEDKRNTGITFLKVPDISFTSGGKKMSKPLWETAKVIAFLGSPADDESIKPKHKYFIDQLKSASEYYSPLTNISEQLSNSGTVEWLRSKMDDLGIKPTDKITFKIGPEYIIDLEDCQEWWRKIHKSSKKKKAKKKSVDEMLCLMTAEQTRPALIHNKIKQLANVGGQASGDALISFKQESFQSFGLPSSANAPVSEENMTTYTQALNVLINESGRKLGDTKIVHWFKNRIRPEDDPLSWLVESEEISELNAQQRAKEMLDSIRSGKKPELHDNFYYALTVSGASGRVMVRDWMEGQFSDLVENINTWFDDLSIVNRNGSGLAPPPKFISVLGASVRVLDDLHTPFVAKMWRRALKGETFPAFALAGAVKRMKIDIINDEPANHARAGLLKAYFVRKERFYGKDITMQPYLNEDHPHPAYHCGRLLAVLAALQRRALGDVGSGIIQRYYTSASATPALVLGKLTSVSQHHLNKIESGGLKYWYEGKIADIWSRIKDQIPGTLSLEEQSLFALGYYQQIADLRTRKVEAIETNEESGEVENV